MTQMTEWESRVKSLLSSSIRIQTQRDALEKEHTKTTKEVEVLSSNLERLTMAGELLRALMDKLVLDQVHSIESVVTEGLKSIFYDEDLAFHAEVGQARGKISIDLMIAKSQSGVEIRGAPLDTFGGGVSSIASLTLRLLALMRLKKFPFLILDETLAAVSAEYTDQAGQFLAKLSETTGIPILLVTHNHMFLDHAKSSYQGEKDLSTEPSLKLKRLRGGVSKGVNENP